MVIQSCFCGSVISYEKCCQPIVLGKQKATTAEVLMRSRYSAYVTHNANYLMASTYFSERKNYSKEEILYWSINNQWIRLEIISLSKTTVEFKAFYTNADNLLKVHHEHSRFIKEKQEWFYVDGDYFEDWIYLVLSNSRFN